MVKVLQIRETPLNKCAGIDANCQGLIRLFLDDEEIKFFPTVDYSRHSDPFIHQYWLDKQEICDSIQKFNPDVVHIHGAYSFTLLVAVKCAKKFHKKIVLSPHFHPFYALRRPLLGKLFFHLITRYVLSDIDLIFTINNEDTKIFKKYHNNVVCIPHWSKFQKPINVLQKNPKMILFVGRLDETNKGIEHLFHLPEGMYEIHCVGKGTIKLRSDMIKHTNITDGELKDLYIKSSLLVVPSRYEAFSFVALEALMNNTPVVLSDRVRIYDHLEGIEGISIFKYHDYSSFVNVVSNTIGKTVDVAMVEEKFCPQKIKANYKNAYLSLFNK